MKKLYVDLGNTYLKIFNKTSEISLLERYLVKEEDTSKDLFERILKHTSLKLNYVIYLINVNFKHQELTKLLASKFVVKVPVQEDTLYVQGTNDKAGADIIASIKALDTKNFKPSIIVSMGTFVTITYVDKYENNMFGVSKILIIPGLFRTLMLANNLLQNSVTNVEIIKNIVKKVYSLNTLNAVVFGTVQLFKSGVLGMLEKYKKTHQIFITGGDAWLFEAISWVSVDPFILIKGLDKL
ncbi:pantothenate kinase [Mycoplasmopsis californica]|uniref:Type III pantothenate kinase n=1 Tax=Mycoplasmopsis equigenitalium TaxID=114883 RepID=A0ABY5J178_9BACT|nr:type III pantothenate kinase [Mycoplasmopsis equigenitalium]UUD37010.1 type III pantothenate kinase [Mycoplasmopsis equigenitalium]VEU69691.1 pantothenate kinase [Mycoplasmopsis californica]